tara:strand:+ start:446 stop:628 length:183 start_codon:yes stop_codon:yes gene_type:complete
MKIKLNSKNIILPNIWKSCGVSHDDWVELHNGNEIEVKSIPDAIKSLVVVSDAKKKKGDK